MDELTNDDLFVDSTTFAVNDEHLHACACFSILLFIPLLVYRAYCMVTRCMVHRQSARNATVMLTPPPLARLADCSTDDVQTSSRKSTPFSNERLVRRIGSPSTAQPGSSKPAWQGPATADLGGHSSWTVTKKERDRLRMQVSDVRNQLHDRKERRDREKEQQLKQKEQKRLLFNLTPERGAPLVAEGTEEDQLGWDLALLASSQLHLADISSLEGHKCSNDYMSWRASDGVMEEQVEAKMDAYRVLRRVDPAAFSQLFSRRDLKDFHSIKAPRVFLLLDYAACCAATISTLVYAMTPLVHSAHTGLDSSTSNAALADEVARSRCMPLILWMLAQCWAFSVGHTSVMGALLGLYSVRTNATYREHQSLATTWQLMAAAVVEAVFVTSTFLLGAALSGLLLLLPSYRQSFSHFIFDMHTVLEASQPTQISRFTPSSPSHSANTPRRYRVPA